MSRKLSDSIRKKWADPEYKKRVSKAISDGWKRRMAEIEAAKPEKEVYHVPDLPGEVWKDVEGYEGMYAVSNMGRVKSLNRDLPHAEHGTWHIKERILKPSLAGPKHSQYLIVCFHEGHGKQRNMRVHRLVALAFIPKLEGKNVVNHKDCNKLNNRVDNLEWCTDLENTHHAMANNRMNWSNVKRSRVVNLDTGEEFNSINEACKKYGVTHRTIYQAASIPGRRSCGFRWQYINP